MVGHNGEQSVAGAEMGRDEWWDITENKVLVEGQ